MAGYKLYWPTAHDLRAYNGTCGGHGAHTRHTSKKLAHSSHVPVQMVRWAGRHHGRAQPPVHGHTQAGFGVINVNGVAQVVVGGHARLPVSPHPADTRRKRTGPRVVVPPWVCEPERPPTCASRGSSPCRARPRRARALYQWCTTMCSTRGRASDPRAAATAPESSRSAPAPQPQREWDHGGVKRTCTQPRYSLALHGVRSRQPRQEA